MINNQLQTKLVELKRQNRIGIMCHAVIGYPTLTESVELIEGMIKAGADIIELQVPFSDPMADGPLIMHANQVALEQGGSTKQSLQSISELTNESGVPITVMTYFQIIHACGVKQFVDTLVSASVSGLIVPDLTPEADEFEGLVVACRSANISFIPVVSPNTSMQRVKLNISRADGLLYCTARQGITGQKTTLDNPIYSFLHQIETYSQIAKAVGFGISNPAQVKALIGHAEVAIVGSAITRAIHENDIKNAVKLVSKLVSAARSSK